MDCQGAGVILSCLIGAGVVYFKTVKIHLVAVLIHSVYLNAMEKTLKRAGALGRNRDAPGTAVPENGC